MEVNISTTTTGRYRALPRADRHDPYKAFLFHLADKVCTWVSTTIPALRAERSMLVVEQVRVPIAHLPQSFDGYRIVQLSDFHFSDDTSYEIAAKAIGMALDLDPDVIVVSGDFLTRYIHAPRAYQILSSLGARDGVWAVLGNHDYWEAPGALRTLLANCGIRELCNAHTAIRRRDQRIWLAGIDDVLEGYPDLGSALSGIPYGEPIVLLAHEPDYVQTVAKTGWVSLMLAGHSHGGQIVMPGLRPFLLPALAQRFWAGTHRVGHTWLHVSRGVGTHSGIRLNCRPAVSAITLTAA